MILVIDNYDSFVYNLAQALGMLGAEPEVRRNDRITVDEISRLHPSHIVISPGPKTPFEAGVSSAVIRRFSGRIPILGVCLGHQCIAHAMGGRWHPSASIMHGKTSSIRHDGRGLYRGLPNPIIAARYHSLSVPEDSLPAELTPTSRAADGELMGIRHCLHPTEGVQFHPESYMTTDGLLLLRNFLRTTS